jgi:hypothetical protein
MAKKEELDKGFEEVPEGHSDLDEGFDAQEPSREEASSSSQAGPSKMEALARGYGKGATFGLQAPLAGLGAAATQAVTGNQGPVQGRNLPALMAAYQQMKNEQIAKNAAAEKAHPVISGIGGVVGSLPTALATGGANPASLGSLATQGGVAGAGNYVGSTENPTIAGTAGNAAMGAGIGAATSKVAPLIGKVAGKAGSAIAGAADDAAGALSKYIPQSLKEGYQAGKEGINLMSKDAQQKVLPEESNKAADNLTKRILAAKQGLMSDLDTHLQSATDGGMVIDHENPPEMQHFSQEDGTIPSDDQLNQDVEGLGSKNQYAGLGDDEEQGSSLVGPDQANKEMTDQINGRMQNPFAKAMNGIEQIVKSDGSYADPTTESGKFAQKLFNKITQFKEADAGAGETPSMLVDSKGNPLTTTAEAGPEEDFRMQLTPLETRNLANEVGDYASVLGKNGESKLAKVANDFQQALRSRLRTEVPDYADAADRLTQFQKYLPETLMSGGQNAADSGVRLSNSASQYQDIKDPAQNMINKLSKSGPGSDTAKQTYNRLEESLDQLNTMENSRKAVAELNSVPFESVFNKMGMTKDEMLNYLRMKSQRSAAYDMMKTGSLPLNTPKTFTQAIADLAGKTGVAAANVIGRTSQNIGGIIYNAPKEVLYSMATKLQTNPATAHLAAGLQSAVSSGDIVKQNAALFAIMQNPTAKRIVDPDAKDVENSSTSLPKKSPYTQEF